MSPVVKQAKELHCRLEHVNNHQNCQLKELRQKLETCRRELVESRAQRLGTESKGDEGVSDVVAKHRAVEHDLKMVRI